MKIEKISIDEIKPYENNAKLLNDRGYEGKKVVFGIRPEHFIKGDRMELDINHVERLGAYSLLHGTLGGIKIIAKVPEWTKIERGEKVKFDYNKDLVCFFDAVTEERIR